ncbi:MAG: hypothetical protein JNL01_00620 [Bdellovibrionales bacterium]|nr:hypothetical protein [Bdellovibrionales bacterium]
MNPFFDVFTHIVNHGGKPLGETDRLRKGLIWAYSWAVPSPEAIALIKSSVPRDSVIVEIGAGTGYWAWLLNQAGFNVQPYDQEPQQPPQWMPIFKGGPEVLARSPDATLFLCWPPLEGTMAEDAINHHQGKFLVYVGEGPGGRTGSDRFHALLDSKYEKIQKLELPRWPGFKDSLFIYQARAF